MSRAPRAVAIVILGIATAMTVARTDGALAASKYKACALLQATEWERVIGQKVGQPKEFDFVVPDGPSKGETVSNCEWTAGDIQLAIGVTRAPQTPERRAAFRANVEKAIEGLKKQGWLHQKKTIDGVECGIARSTPSSSIRGDIVFCAVENRLFALALTVAAIGASARVSPEQVKGLADLALSRAR